MTSRLNPYLSFDGAATEAMAFYQSVLGGTLVVNTYGDSGHPDTAVKDRVMHAMLETDLGFTLMASDSIPESPPTTVGNNITLSISGDDSDALTGYFDGLSEGGAVDQPLERMMWGDVFGHFTDRFGIDWLVNISDGAEL